MIRFPQRPQAPAPHGRLSPKASPALSAGSRPAISRALFIWMAMAPALLLLMPSSLMAQGGPARLTGPEKMQLLAIAAEPLAAAVEERAPRVPQVGERLNQPQPCAVSLYLDGKLVARSWELERPGPLSSQVGLLGASALTSPDYGSPPDPGDLARIKVGVTVFYRFRQIKDDSEVGKGDGVVVINGFKEGVASPKDVPEGAKAADLLSFAAVAGGMRPGAWMLPEASLLAAPADDERAQ